MSLLLVACAFPLLSFALPSSHTHSLHHRYPSPLRPRIMTYYADWAPPQAIDYSLFDTILFAFALPDQDYQLRWDSDQAPSLLESVVPAAHAAATKVSLSIGGWTGSRPVPSSLTLLTPHPIYQVLFRRGRDPTEQGTLCQQHPRDLQAVRSRRHRHRLGVPRSSRTTGKQRERHRFTQHAPVLQTPSAEAPSRCHDIRCRTRLHLCRSRRSTNEGRIRFLPVCRLDHPHELRRL